MMRHVLYFLILPILLSLIFLSDGTAQYTFDIAVMDEYEYIDDRIIIKFKDDASPQAAAFIQQELEATKVHEFKFIGAEVWEISGITVRDAVLQYREHPAVEYIEPDLIIHLDLPGAERTGGPQGGIIRDNDDRLIPNDPLFNQMWHLYNTGQTNGTPGADVDATRAWTIHTGDTILIAIVDSGIDYNHVDLADNIWEHIGINTINPGNPPMDGHGHGTHVAGTVAAVGNNEIGVAGVTWVAKLMAVKIFSDAGNTTTTAIVDGVEYTVEQGAQLSNHSWGGPFSNPIFQAFQLTQQAGQLVVAAAGNHNANNDTNPRYPAAYPLDNIIAVAASNHNDVKAYYSAWGPNTVHLAAPGGDTAAPVISTLPNNNYGGAGWFGTSMASPHTAGAAALVWSLYSDWDYLKVKNHLMLTVDTLAHWQNTYPVISGGRLNVYRALHEPDTIPPAPITDLEAIDVQPFSVTLQWTASGASGDTGQASLYDIRYSTEPITEENFHEAIKYPDPPEPAQPGETEQLTITGLTHSTTYYFAVKTADMWLNWSDLSNPVSVTTLDPPIMVIDPEHFDIEMESDQISTELLTVSNPGEGTLEFSFLGAAALARLDAPGPAGAGGPDQFGYVWLDNLQEGGPAYHWIDIAETGSVIEFSDNWDGHEDIPLPFSFPFYGNENDNVRVFVNGIVHFGSHAGAADYNREIPSTTQPTDFIAAYWDDLDMRTHGNVYYYYHEPYDRFVIQYENVGRTGREDSYTFQVILYPSGMVVVQYKAMNISQNSATVGIENPDGTDGLQVIYNAPYVEDGLTIAFVPSPPSWLTISPSDGLIPENEQLELDVTFNTSTMSPGFYEHYLPVSSNDPERSLFAVPVTLLVDGGAPSISVTPDELDFGSLFTGDNATLVLTVENQGLAHLEITGIDLSGDGFGYEGDTEFSIKPVSSTELSVTFSPDDIGLYSGTFTISSNDPDNPQVIVDLTGEGIPAPVIAVDPESLEAELVPGEKTIHEVTITNEGGSDLHLDIRIPSPASTQTPSVAAAGGPDNFGYRWVDSNEPGQVGPDFEWFEISQIGTVIDPDDRWDGHVDVDLPFTFPFYGKDNETIRIFVNGFLHFGNFRLRGYNNRQIPSTFQPTEVLAAYWDNLDMRTNGDIYYYHDEDGDRFIVQYDGIGRTGRDDIYTFQAILYPTGAVVYQYLSMDISQHSATVGIENQDGTDGLGIVFNEPYVHDSLAVHIDLWLTASPRTATIPAGEYLGVDVQFDAVGLAAGEYTMDFSIVSNDPVTPEFIIPVTMMVTGEPGIAVEPDKIDFGEIFVGYSGETTLTVTNNGSDELIVTSVESDHEDFTVDETDFTLGIGESQELTVTFSPGSDGTVTASLVIESNAPGSPHTIPLEGTGVVPPELAFNPESFTETVNEGDQLVRVLVLYNEGGSMLSFSISAQEGSGNSTAEGVYKQIAERGIRSSEEKTVGNKPLSVPENVRSQSNDIAIRDGGIESVPWIGFDIESGDIDPDGETEIDVTFDASQLSAGVYHAEIVVSSNDPATPSAAIPVELTVEETLPLPDQVVLAYPGDDAFIEIPDDEPEIKMGWYPSQPQIDFYQLDIARDENFSDVVYTDAELADTFYVYTGFEDNETYYWRVRAENETGWGEYSDVWSFTVLVVGVGGTEIPEVYSLMQNYPNPFNPSTVIRYGLPERSTVKLEIYNTLGQRVATLVNTELEAGYHDAEWYPGHAASGMYIYRLEAIPVDNRSERFIEVKRMILLK